MTTFCKVPQRMCLACRERKPKEELIKITKSKEGNFAVNKPAAEGRSAYICKSDACIAKCKKTKGLNRAFKGEVPAVIYDALSTEEIFESR